MNKFYIPIILGSTRRGRNSSRVSSFMKNELSGRPNVDTEVIDLAEIDLPMMEERLRFLESPPKAVVEFGEKIGRSDAIVIVSPEYNGGYPGVLKNAIDYLQPEYRKKPVGLVTVSTGAMGGFRVLEQLRDVMTSVGALPIPAALGVPRVRDSVNEDGSPNDETVEKRARKFVDELLWYTEAIVDMKKKREEAVR